MTSPAFLTKAIQKAIEGGWLPYFASFDTNITKDNIVIRYIEGTSSINFDYEMKGHIVGVGGYNLEPYSIIFNHDFAKALWGDDLLNQSDGTVFRPNKLPAGFIETSWTKHAWQYHLQQMVIADDPIKYLGEHLDG